MMPNARSHGNNPSTGAGGRTVPQDAARPPTSRRRLLAVLLALGIASTTLHYSHNYTMAEMYPPVPILFPTPLAYRIGILVFWPLLTALALWGYRQYTRGQLGRARVALIIYSPLGISTIGHFLGGVPQIPPLFFATIFTDFLTGLAVLIFALTLTAQNNGATLPAPAVGHPDTSSG